MEEEVMIDLLKERLCDNYGSSNIENLNIPVVLEDMCVVLKKRVVVCHVEDEAKAMFSLWRYASNEMPVLFISTKRDKYTLFNDFTGEVFGKPLSEFDFNKKGDYKTLGSFIDQVAESPIYMLNGDGSLSNQNVQDIVKNAEVKVIVVDN